MIFTKQDFNQRYFLNWDLFWVSYKGVHFYQFVIKMKETCHDVDSALDTAGEYQISPGFQLMFITIYIFLFCRMFVECMHVTCDRQQAIELFHNNFFWQCFFLYPSQMSISSYSRDNFFFFYVVIINFLYSNIFR